MGILWLACSFLPDEETVPQLYHGHHCLVLKLNNLVHAMLHISEYHACAPELQSFGHIWQKDTVTRPGCPLVCAGGYCMYLQTITLLASKQELSRVVPVQLPEQSAFAPCMT
jgi:hypothetical protein